MLSMAMLSGIVLIVIRLSVVILSPLILSVIQTCAVMLGVVMLSVLNEWRHDVYQYAKCRYAECHCP
jgi:hypothetical protein